MMKPKLSATLFSLAMLANPAFAQDFVDAKIQDLFSQGYTHFEVTKDPFKCHQFCVHVPKGFSWAV